MNAVGHSEGVVIAWNEVVFSRVDAWTDQFSAVAKLKWQTDDLEIVVVSAYGPVNPTNRKHLWRELAGVVSTFQGSPMLIGGDFNMTLEAKDRPNDMGGRDPDS